MVTVYTKSLLLAMREKFRHEPTSQQTELFELLAEFVCSKNERSLFVLTGYAGTGKTSVVSALVKALKQQLVPVVLLAPTGRAAKVLSGYSSYKANTIHRRIYFIKTAPGGGLVLTMQKNNLRDAVFVVDEASMIPDDTKSKIEGGRNLLADLMDFTYSGYRCKMIFVGDTAQLPPVGLSLSPALETSLLKAAYHLQLFQHELTEVVRQEKESGILANATYLRELIYQNQFNPPYFDIYGYKDIKTIDQVELQDELFSCYQNIGQDETIVITRSNKRANAYNREIRNRILFREGELAAGDLLMIVKNNYYWLEKEGRDGFLANGDVIEIMALHEIEEVHGFRFAEIRARMVDFPEEGEINLKVLLDTLFVERPALSLEENNRLFTAILEKYADIPTKHERMEKIKADPYFNALQIKFAYAFTCHKTQGGQWNTVFLDSSFIGPDGYDREYLRWLYTALTRATHKIFLVNYPEAYFKQS